ncbi:hypothetical protein Tco_0170225 [Tanacetum coccineum]
MAQVRKLSPEQLQEEFDKIQRAVAFTRGFKRDGSPMTRASSKKLKTGGDDVNLEVPSHGVPQEEAGATPSPNVSQEEVAAPSHSQDIPDAQVEVPSNIASTAQHTASSLKKVGTERRISEKEFIISHSTIPIEDGDPEAKHKMCLKYASDVDSASDDDYTRKDKLSVPKLDDVSSLEVEMVCNQHVRSNLLGQGFSSPTSNVLHGSNPFWVPMVTSPRVNGYCFKVLLFNPSGASKTVLSRNLKFNVSDSSLGRGLLGFL